MCAIAGIVNNSEASRLIYMMLHALQHRGQEGCGISSCDGTNHYVVRKPGLVRDVIDEPTITMLQGHAAIGHTRYSTAGGTSDANLQPFLMRTRLGSLSIVHNGNLVNAPDLVRSLEKQGSIFQSSSDTEVILHLLARSGDDNLLDALPKVLRLLEGAYSLLLLDKDVCVAIRDPLGFRPLVMGSLGDSLVFASETTALDLIGAAYVREVLPGEMIVAEIGTGKYTSSKPFKSRRRCRCVFEHIYFAKPDSNLFGANVYQVRKLLGKQLAREHPAKADMVISVPDSGTPAAIGYAEESKIPFDMGLIRSQFVSRTFIQPKQHLRDFSVRLKMNAIGTIKDKRLVVVDDSVVRGTTSRKIIQLLREAGAKEIHMRISAPPTVSPCVYGIDTPTKEELLAAKIKDPKAIAEAIGADTIGYLSLEGLRSVVDAGAGTGWCDACFSGNYPTDAG